MKKKSSREPKYDLQDIKRAFDRVTKLNMTYSAMRGQYELGFDDQTIVEVIQLLKEKDFYKSMLPTHVNFAEWQDVYKPIYKDIELYIKFQIDKRGKMIISFKAR